MQTVISTDTATLKVYPEKGIVHHEFHKFMFGDNFRNFMTKAAEVFTQNRCHKWLSDDRGNSALKPEDMNWATTVWEKKVLKAGWKSWAIVLPEKVIGQMSIKKIAEHYKSLGVNVNAFSDPNQAMTWLEQQ